MDCSKCWGRFWAELGLKKSDEFPLSRRALKSTTEKMCKWSSSGTGCKCQPGEKKIEQLGNGIWKLVLKNYLFWKLIHLGITQPFLFPIFLLSRGGRDVSRYTEKQRLSAQQQGSEWQWYIEMEMGVVDLICIHRALCPEASWFNHGKSTPVALQLDSENC